MATTDQVDGTADVGGSQPLEEEASAAESGRESRESSKSTASTIRIYGRMRPSPKALLEQYDIQKQSTELELRVPRRLANDYVNNSKETYRFGFNHVFGPETTQDAVFDVMAKDIVDGALEGFNGTIFAYGQTGSGKTFTITGGPEKYADRGIIPRTLSYMFAEFAKQTDTQYTMKISYMELYRDQPYDLLDPDHETKELEDLPKVKIVRDDADNIVMQNLSMHQSATEEEALNWLFLGDTNRMIAETPMNMASSRSHCIFTIYLEARRKGSAVIRRSKLNLVDLAGSERVKKSGVSGQLMSEAIGINSSLHFLEQVIVALWEQSRGQRSHVPYRNCRLTSVLQDSLGGNCRTSMIATVSAEPSHFDETIGTCRFAQRVGMIRNKAVVNEELDPYEVIRSLRAENARLRAELAIASGHAERGEMSEEQRQQLQNLVNAYVASQEQEPVLMLGDMTQMHRAAAMLRTLVLEARVAGIASGEGSAATISSGDTAALVDRAGGSDAAKKLAMQVQQRDNEISILVNMLRRKKQSRDQASQTGSDPTAAADGQQMPPRHAPATSSAELAKRDKQRIDRLIAENEAAAAAASAASDAAGGSDAQADSIGTLKQRSELFEEFRKSYRKNQFIEDNKQILRDKFAEAKAAGQRVNMARNRINQLKSVIEQLRVERAMQGLSTGADGEGDVSEDPEELRQRQAIDKEKQVYKGNFERLRVLKGEIEHLQLMLEQSRLRLMKDFEAWYRTIGVQHHKTMQRRQQQQQQLDQQGSSPSHGHLHRQRSMQVPVQAIASTIAETATDAAPASSSISTSSSATPSLATPTAATRPAAVSSAKPSLTGNAQADADILAFYQARDKLRAKQQRQMPGLPQ